MAFNIVAILKNKHHTISLDYLNKILSKYLPYATISVDDGCPPILVKHLVVTVKENDFGEVGSWSADVLLEEDETINKCNKEAIISDGATRNDKEEILNSFSRVRVYFRDDAERKYTNTMIDLMSFLEAIPDAAIYDSAQEKFINQNP